MDHGASMDIGKAMGGFMNCGVQVPFFKGIMYRRVYSSVMEWTGCHSRFEVHIRNHRFFPFLDSTVVFLKSKGSKTHTEWQCRRPLETFHARRREICRLGN